MGSINQWHKSVLFACIAIVLFSGSVKAQPEAYISGPTYILNAFEVSVDQYLDGVSLWAVGYETYSVNLYSSFDSSTGTFGTLLASGQGGTTTAGQFDIHLTTSPSLAKETSYYLHVTSQNALNFGHLGVVGDFGADYTGAADDVSYFSFDNTAWHDLYNDYGNAGLSVYGSGGASVPNPANFVMDLLTSPLPNITASKVLGDNWTLDAQSFDGTDTLDLYATATEMEPMVKLIEVDSDMGQMTLTEDVLNSITERDWIGFGFQLGYWDAQNQRFVASTEGDDLYFGYSTSTEFGPAATLSEDHILFSNGLGLVEPGETASFELLINLPGGSDNFSFALRQYAVPEPSTFLLLAVSGMMMLLCGRRRR